MSPFDPNFKPHGAPPPGVTGDPSVWRKLFEQRLNPEEIKVILGDDDPWTVLGLSAGASQEDIKRAYRRKSMQTHPDQGGDAEAFKKIKAAYDKLRSD
jgi:DnaJ-domain-containing protein 1